MHSDCQNGDERSLNTPGIHRNRRQPPVSEGVAPEVLTHLDLISDFAAFRESINIRFQSKSQSQLVQHRRMEEIGYGANLRRSLSDQIQILVYAPSCSRAQLSLIFQVLRNIHTDCSQELTYTVVELTGDSSSLRVLYLQNTRRDIGLFSDIFWLPAGR